MRIEVRYSPPDSIDLSGTGVELWAPNQEIKKFLSESQNRRVWNL